MNQFLDESVFAALSDSFGFVVYVTISGFWMFPPLLFFFFFKDLDGTYSIYREKCLLSFFVLMEKGCH